MNRPIIDDEFASLLPPLMPEEQVRLQNHVLAEGCRDPLVVWKEENVLLDGHHRLQICDESGIAFEITYLSFPDRVAAIAWVVETQLGRRNLNDEQHAYYMGKEYLRDRNRPGNPQFRQNDGIGNSSGKTAKRIAAREGVSISTVERNAAFAAAVDSHESATPGTKERILSGDSKLTKQEVIETAPRLYDRCKRVGPPPLRAVCPACAELKKGSKPAPPSPGNDPSCHDAELAVAGAKLVRRLWKMVEQFVQGKRKDVFLRCARKSLLTIRLEAEQPDPMIEEYTETLDFPELRRLEELFESFEKEVRE